jgi:hypothetical protein
MKDAPLFKNLQLQAINLGGRFLHYPSLGARIH